MIRVTREGPPADSDADVERVRTTMSPSSPHFLVPVTMKQGRHIRTNAVIDSGAASNYIHKQFVEKHKLQTEKLPRPQPLYNVDGSQNNIAMMTEHVTLQVDMDGMTTDIDFKVADLYNNDVIIGLPWLRHVGPTIDWKEKTISMPESIRSTREELMPNWTLDDLTDDWEICNSYGMMMTTNGVTITSIFPLTMN